MTVRTSGEEKGRSRLSIYTLYEMGGWPLILKEKKKKL